MEGTRSVVVHSLSCPPHRSTASTKQWCRSAVHRSRGNLERTYCRTFPRVVPPPCRLLLAPLSDASGAFVAEVVLLSEDKLSDEPACGLIRLPTPANSTSFVILSTLSSSGSLCFPSKSMWSRNDDRLLQHAAGSTVVQFESSDQPRW